MQSSPISACQSSITLVAVFSMLFLNSLTSNKFYRTACCCGKSCAGIKPRTSRPRPTKKLDYLDSPQLKCSSNFWDLQFIFKNCQVKCSAHSFVIWWMKDNAFTWNDNYSHENEKKDGEIFAPNKRFHHLIYLEANKLPRLHRLRYRVAGKVSFLKGSGCDSIGRPAAPNPSDLRFNAVRISDTVYFKDTFPEIRWLLECYNMN